MASLKNPLAQLFGLCVQQLRSQAGFSSDEVASRMGISASSYRMMESGAAPLHPGRALDLVRVLDTVEFDALSRVLIALQVIENAGRSFSEWQQAAQNLEEVDPQLGQLLAHLHPIWQQPKLKPQQVSKLLEQNRAVKAMIDFFTTNRFFGLDKGKRLDFQLNNLIDNTPSIYLDFILDSLKNLHRYRLHYFPEDSSSWESDNKHQFTELHAVIAHSVDITHIDNFKSFDYNYLWQPQFEKLKFVFLDQGRPVQEIFETFKRELQAALQMQPNKYRAELDNFDAAMEKVSFKNGTPQAEAFEKMLQFGPNGELTEMLWIFTMLNGNKVGFISNAHQQKVFYGTTLSYKETRERLNTINSLWNDLPG